MTEASRYAGDPDRVALVFPGSAYSPARPLLHYANAVLRRHGWTVREVWYDELEPQVQAKSLADTARAIVDRQTASRLLLVGKSLGSRALPVAAERGLPGIWLTPLLTEPEVVAALEQLTAPTLLVGGTGDLLWDSDVAHRLEHEFLELPYADHGLELPGDPIHSAELLVSVVAAMEAFVGGLRGSSAHSSTSRRR
ncbi:MAG: alpha/beta hydrolase [Carbonactinosporaceae bacterium]